MCISAPSETFRPFRGPETGVYIYTHRLEPLPSIEEGGGRRTRRFTSFYYTLVDKVPPIHFAVPHVSVRKDEVKG